MKSKAIQAPRPADTENAPPPKIIFHPQRKRSAQSELANFFLHIDNEAIVTSIDGNVTLLPSGCEMGFRYNLHKEPLYDPIKAEIERLFQRQTNSGWVVRFPVGFKGGQHSHSVDLAIYYPRTHASDLVLRPGVGREKRFVTEKGTFGYVPIGIPHLIEEIMEEPRYAVVWILR